MLTKSTGFGTIAGLIFLLTFTPVTVLAQEDSLEVDESPASTTDNSGSLFTQGGDSDDDEMANQVVDVSSTGMIDLHVKDLEITQVLQLLSIQSQRNIVASRNVAGRISADLYSVDFYEALEAVLSTNGFGFREKGNFIYVYTAEELATMEEAERKRVHRVVRLNYLSASDASTFVSPLLSPGGTIAISADVTAGFEPSVGDGGANSFASADTLVIRDYEENIEQIKIVLAELDIRPSQVLLETTVLRSELDEDNAWGVDLTVLADFSFNEFAGGAGEAINRMMSGAITGSAQAFQTSVGDTATRFGSRVGILTDDVAAFIKALDEVIDTTILSHPKILVLNRQRADLLIGQRLGYISSTATETSTTQTVEFLDVGTQLTVRPFVSDDGFIRLELRPSVSTGTTSVQQGFVIPQEDTQQLTTNVMVRSGNTVVLGGLFKEETVITRKQLPGVGDIPLLGAAFKGHDDAVNRSEVIFLMTPTVVKDESMLATAEHAADRMDMAKLGARQGLLPWSRTKLTTTYLHEAVKAHQAGDDKRALWACNLALRLDPKFIRARELKEQIVGRRDFDLNQSILNEAINCHIDKAIKEPISHSDMEPANEAAPMPVYEASAPTETTQVEMSTTAEPTAEPVAVELTDGETTATEQTADETPAQPVQRPWTADDEIPTPSQFQPVQEVQIEDEEEQAATTGEDGQSSAISTSDNEDQITSDSPVSGEKRTSKAVLDAIDEWIPVSEEMLEADNASAEQTASVDIPASE